MAEETKKTVLKKGERVINLKEKTTVVALKGAPHHKEGKEVVCHPEVAKWMIKHGWAKAKGKSKDETVE
jgi:hypothetical protein